MAQLRWNPVDLRVEPSPLQQAMTDTGFFPGFWDGTGRGYGVCVETAGDHRGRYGWAGGQGTDFFVDRDGTIAILLTQVELGERMGQLFTEFQAPLG